jgi:hypothetical protein
MSEHNQQLAIRLNNTIANVIGQKNVIGFEKAFILSNAIAELKQSLTPEYMRPIMEIQGNKLGFKTDKDKDGGYSETIVKNCLIEAVLFGLQPAGNQFNIIGGNMYATKEGLKYLLDNFKGLSYDLAFGVIEADLPNYQMAVTCNVPVTLNWNLDGKISQHTIVVQVKANKGMGVDAVIGKVTRKASKWLYDKVSGTAIPEGEVEFSSYQTIPNQKEDVDFEELSELYELKKDLIEDKLKANAARIIDTLETASYQKLFDYLKAL